MLNHCFHSSEIPEQQRTLSKNQFFLNYGLTSRYHNLLTIVHNNQDKQITAPTFMQIEWCMRQYPCTSLGKQLPQPEKQQTLYKSQQFLTNIKEINVYVK